MKIVHYHRNIRLEKGGVVRFVLDVCAAMAARGHEVTLASPDVTDAPGAWASSGAGLPRVVKLPVPGMAGLWAREGRRAVEHAITGCDVVHLHGAWMPSNVQAGRACERLKVPYVVSPHGMLDDWCTAQSAVRKRVYHALAGQRLFDRAAVVHCTAQAELDQSQKWFPASRSAVIPLLLDMGPFHVLPGAGEARAAFGNPAGPVVLFLSRLHPKKGVEVLIDAVGLMRERGTACDLLIAGAGEAEYVRALEARAAGRGIGDRTRFLGMVTGRMKVSLYQLAEVFALPTSQENFGLVLAEAMACGTPAVTTRGVDIWPELEAGGGALLAGATAPEFAATLGRVLAEPALRKRLSDAARGWVLKYLAPEAVAVQYEAMYADICT